MTREEAKHIVDVAFNVSLAVRRFGEDRTYQEDEIREAKNMAIKALEQEPCEDAISRQAGINIIDSWLSCDGYNEAERHIMIAMQSELHDLPSVNPQPKTGHCKECKYFEYNRSVKVDGIPLIVAHEICSRWGDGCKTKEDGYCFMYEAQESEV